MTVKINGLRAYDLAKQGDLNELTSNGWHLTCLIETDFGEVLTYVRVGVDPAWWQAREESEDLVFHYTQDQA